MSKAVKEVTKCNQALRRRKTKEVGRKPYLFDKAASAT